MKIVYQGRPEETACPSLAGYLAAKGVDAAKAIVECAGEIYAPGADLTGVALKDGVEVNVFRVVAGG